LQKATKKKFKITEIQTKKLIKKKVLQKIAIFSQKCTLPLEERKI